MTAAVFDYSGIRASMEARGADRWLSIKRPEAPSSLYIASGAELDSFARAHGMERRPYETDVQLRTRIVDTIQAGGA